MAGWHQGMRNVYDLEAVLYQPSQMSAPWPLTTPAGGTSVSSPIELLRLGGGGCVASGLLVNSYGPYLPLPCSHSGGGHRPSVPKAEILIKLFPGQTTSPSIMTTLYYTSSKTPSTFLLSPKQIYKNFPRQTYRHMTQKARLTKMKPST